MGRYIAGLTMTAAGCGVIIGFVLPWWGVLMGFILVIIGLMLVYNKC